MSEDQTDMIQESWDKYRDAHPEHNVPYGDRIYAAGWNAAASSNFGPRDGQLVISTQEWMRLPWSELRMFDPIPVPSSAEKSEK